MVVQLRERVEEKSERMLEDLHAQENFTGAEVSATELISNVVLVTYDLPVTKEGNQIRNWFLHEARRIGAVAHTESVYLLPWSTEANYLATSLSKRGSVSLFFSRIGDPDTQRQVTAQYDLTVEKWLDDIQERIDKVEFHKVNKHFKLATNMAERTSRMIGDLAKVIANRGSARLEGELSIIKRQLAAAVIGLYETIPA